MININNYHKRTQGTFQILKTKSLNKRLNTSDKFIKFVESNFSNFKFHFSSNGGSFYFFNEKTNELIRASNHWSNKTYGQYISTCKWYLNKWVKYNDNKFIIAKINLNDLTNY